MSITVNSINPTYINQPGLRKNSVTFSAVNPKNDYKKEKNKLPAILLTALSIALGVLGFIKLRKSDKVFKDAYIKKLEEVQLHLKNIFGKDFAIDEANSFLQKYQELHKIADNKEYYKKLFEQLKADFQVENKDLVLELWEKPMPVNGGEFAGYTEALTRKIGATCFEERIKTFKNLFHEFKHVKQNELMYRADPQRLIQAKVTELEKSNNASWQEILRTCSGDKAKARKIVQDEVENVYRKNWNHLKPVSKTSPEYSQALKYLENEENRIPPGEHYYEQILEKEAQFVEKAAEKLYEILINIAK